MVASWARVVTVARCPDVARSWTVWGETSSVTGTDGSAATAATVASRAATCAAAGRDSPAAGSASRARVVGRCPVAATVVANGTSSAKRSRSVSAASV